MSRIHALARHLKRQGDERSVDQIRADILMDLLEGNSTHTSAGAGGVEIRVNLTTLMGLDEEPGDIAGWGPVISDLARQVAYQRSHQWRWVVTDPETGEPLHTGLTRRRPTAAQRRHIQARDPQCVFPGCPAAAIRCHLDHTVDYSRKGPTIVANLGPLCARHHLRAKHRAGWRLTQPEPGHYHWTSPRGHNYQVEPSPP